MIWSKNLYVGENAKVNKHSIMKKIKRNKPQLGVYVLTLPENDNNILDIYPSIVLLQPHFKNKELFIVGIASCKEEALQVMENIVMDCYRATGAFKIEEYVNIC